MIKSEPSLEVERLRERLEEAEDTLRAIRSGEVDAVVVSGPRGEQIFALKGAEQPYRVFLETMNEGAVILMADGTITYSNRRFAEMVQTPLEHVPGTSIECFVAPENRLRLRSVLSSALTGDTKEEIPFLTADGSAVWAELSLSLTRLEGSPVICLVATDITERKRGEELRTYLASIVDCTDEAIIGKSLDGRILSWNAGAERLYQYSAAEIIGQLITVLCPSDRVDESLGILEKIGRGETVERYETERVRRDGQRIQVSLAVSPIRDLEGRVKGASTIARDITQLKQADAARQESERAFRTLADLVPQLVWMCTPDGLNIYFNQQWVDYTGLTLAESYGRGWNIPFHSDDKQAAWDAWNHATATGDTYRIESRLRAANGSYRWFLMRGVPLRDEAGAIVKWFGTCTDIEDLKRAEETLRKLNDELRRASAYNRSLIEASLDPLVTVAPNGTITDVNKATEKITGLSRQALIGTDFCDYFTDPEKARTGYRHVFKEGWVQDYDLEIRRPDGTTTPVLYNASVYRNEAGEPVGVFAAARDITERKRAEEEIKELNVSLERRVIQRTADLVAANKELEAFSYTVSHDLRAPLRAMDGFSQVLMSEHADKLGAEGNRLLQRIRLASQRMSQLIDGILGLSRMIRSGLRRTTVDMGALARTVALELQKANPQREVKFTAAPGLVVNADADLLRIALENLLSNAWKFTAKHAHARVEVGKLDQEGTTVYFVRDDGAGFDMAYSSGLFEAFHRLHSVTEFEGTGIGLATAQRIVQRHGGRIWAEGEVEKGATFFFTMPMESR